MRVLIALFLAISLFFVSAQSARAWIITPSVEDEHDHEALEEHDVPVLEAVTVAPIVPVRPYSAAQRFVPPPAPAVYFVGAPRAVNVFVPQYERRLVYPARLVRRPFAPYYYR